ATIRSALNAISAPPPIAYPWTHASSHLAFPLRQVGASGIPIVRCGVLPQCVPYQLAGTELTAAFPRRLETGIAHGRARQCFVAGAFALHLPRADRVPDLFSAADDQRCPLRFPLDSGRPAAVMAP